MQTVSEVSVDVVDVNDEIPTFSQNYHGIIKENSPPGTTVTIVSDSLDSIMLSDPGKDGE